jgi:CheY-like chemotaxis protein
MNTGRELIFLVDDDSRSTRVLAHMLREDGHKVELAFDGAAALGRLTRDPLPTVLVVDVRMPHVDGIAVARYARSRSPHIPIIFLTSYPQLVIDKALPGDLKATIHGKPVDYHKLRAQISAVQAEACAATPSDNEMPT